MSDIDLKGSNYVSPNHEVFAHVPLRLNLNQSSLAPVRVCPSKS